MDFLMAPCGKLRITAVILRPVLDDLLAFECLIDELTVRYQVLYLCIYDYEVAPVHFNHAHSKIIQENQVMNNSAYIPPPEFRSYLRRRAEIGLH
jgi:hypothetical protein